MIGPKRPLPSRADEADAYELATLRDGNRCQMRGLYGIECLGAPQRDHRQNRRAGNTVVSNIHLLCVAHHMWKTEHPLDAHEEGWGVPGWGVPSAWPARRWRVEGGALRLGWVTYDDEGGVTPISDAEAMRRMGGAE